MYVLHVISHPTFFDGEIEAVKCILTSCDVYFHLRKPQASEEEYLAFLNQIPSRFYSKVVLHACYHLSAAYAWAACHFSTSKRVEASKYAGTTVLSTSCHSIDELKTVQDDFDQCFLSPIFDSISKSEYYSTFDHSHLEGFLSQERTIEVIALGGVQVENINRTKLLGFNGAAVLGAVWGHYPQAEDNFERRVQDLLLQINSPLVNRR